MSLVREMLVLAVARQLACIVHHYVGCMLDKLDLSRAIHGQRGQRPPLG